MSWNASIAPVKALSPICPQGDLKGYESDNPTEEVDT